MEYVFHLSIPLSAWIILLLILIVLFIIALIIFIPIITFSIRVNENTIKASSLFSYKITVGKEDVENIYVVDLSKHPELRPKIRTFGTGLPGLNLGWFKLANGSKAFLAITNNKQGVVIKLRDGTYVILSPKNIQEFINTLKQLGWIK
ncbi:MAG: hypothetical protein J7J82_04690 [Staphylothermus sp.]|nr:hypothetical protein [Staphylothermus sp.]